MADSLRWGKEFDEKAPDPLQNPFLGLVKDSKENFSVGGEMKFEKVWKAIFINKNCWRYTSTENSANLEIGINLAKIAHILDLWKSSGNEELASPFGKMVSAPRSSHSISNYEWWNLKQVVVAISLTNTATIISSLLIDKSQSNRGDIVVAVD
ncbi:Uncharacterized protein Fot_11525 [Forsythia ovata]|uniref:Uncharacterized protein n=1 Tax=Forsythia ovata TaxID=205694 RepID=A0ABD1WNN3_9LAMI